MNIDAVKVRNEDAPGNPGLNELPETMTELLTLPLNRHNSIRYLRNLSSFMSIRRLKRAL
jgi:hypothetical protein